MGDLEVELEAEEMVDSMDQGQFVRFVARLDTLQMYAITDLTRLMEATTTDMVSLLKAIWLNKLSFQTIRIKSETIALMP